MEQEIKKELSEMLNEFKKGLVTDAEMKSFVDAAVARAGNAEEIEQLKSAIKEQGIVISRFEKSGGVPKNDFQEQIKAFVESEDNRRTIKSNGKVEIFLKMKADAAPMYTSTTGKIPINVFNTEVVPGIGSAPQEPNAIFPRLFKGMATSEIIRYVNRGTISGGAAFIAEGQVKPLMSWDYTQGMSTAAKVAVKTKISTEMLNDFPYIISEINTLMRDDLMQEVDKQLLIGDGSSYKLKGILTDAGGYIGSDLDGSVERANEADAVRASMLAMRMLNFTPNTLFINPTEKAGIDLTKDASGRYMSDELLKIIAGVSIVETTRIDPGKFLLMDTSKWVVKVLENLRLESGLVNDDFEKNMVTYIAEMRLHSYQNTIDAGSVIYDSFDTVIAALNKTTQAAV